MSRATDDESPFDLVIEEDPDDTVDLDELDEDDIDTEDDRPDPNQCPARKGGNRCCATSTSSTMTSS